MAFSLASRYSSRHYCDRRSHYSPVKGSSFLFFDVTLSARHKIFDPEDLIIDDESLGDLEKMAEMKGEYH